MASAEIITLTCPSCGARVSVPENSNRFTCGYCGNEHILQINVQAVDKPAAPVPYSAPSGSSAAAGFSAATGFTDSTSYRAVEPAIRPRIPVPASVQIVKEGQSARIVQRWFSWKYLPMAFFAIAWDAFLLFWYGMAFSMKAPWIFIVFPIAHLAVGVGITYSTITGFFNRTTLELTPGELAVMFDPFPWFGEKHIKTTDIKQLYCKEHVSSNKNGTTRTYELYAVTQDLRQVKLVGNLDSPDIALFFEQQLETWLHITDQPVVGELPK